MNTKNNKRRQETIRRIESVFMEFLKEQELSQIKVTAICEKAGINRGTFYANFVDVYDLADKMHERLKIEVNSLFEQNIKQQSIESNFAKLFEHIKDNQALYYFYFKLGYDDDDDLNLLDIYQAYHSVQSEHIDYHISFFKGGFNALVKKWLNNDCDKTPQQMNDILMYEYRGRFA